MEIKDNVIDMRGRFELKQLVSKIRHQESERIREALFMEQHSDDDAFDNINEFEFDDKQDS